MSEFVLHAGDCLDVLDAFEDGSVDAIVTDPPYGLAFMGKRWDYDVPSEAIWRACLRVLKPGGHLLAFAGTRTQHRMAVRIEDAGFEIRDLIAWVYGSGFPKSLDVGKAIDRRGGAVADFVTFRDAVKQAMERNGINRQKLTDALGNHMTSHYLTAGSQPAIPNLRDYRIIRDVVGLGHAFDDLFNDEAAREVVGRKTAGIANPGEVDRRTIGASCAVQVQITAPATDAARQWHGWGTALKPALEPITVARRPLAGTVASNVLAFGTGALNIDGSRIEGDRWPANLIHDGGPEALDLLGEAARFFYCAKASRADREDGLEAFAVRTAAETVERVEGSAGLSSPRAGAGRTSGARNHHPTVKPTDLMRYLVRLVTPPGGLVLDPFAGSGTTGKAAVLEGFRFVGIERDPDYVAIADARCRAAVAARVEVYNPPLLRLMYDA